MDYEYSKEEYVEELIQEDEELKIVKMIKK
jgi:hypothetical protein